MTYTTALIFSTLLHNQNITLDSNSKFAVVQKNQVNTPVILALESRGLARTIADGQVVVKPNKIEEFFSNPYIIDVEILDSVMRGPDTTSW